MKPRNFILSDENPRVENVRQRAIDVIKALSFAKPIEVYIGDYDAPRTLEQNRYYWAAMIQPLSEFTGYTKEEMHEILLAEKFGTVTVGKLTLPARRSSKLKKKEMMEYLDWVPRFAAEMGVVISVPEQ